MNREKLAELIDRLNQLSTAAKFGILVGIMVVLCGSYWYWFWSPKVEELNSLKVKIQKREKVLNEYRLITKKLPLFKKQFKKLTLQFEAASRKLPSKKEIPGLIDAIYEAVSASGLRPSTFTPKGEVIKEVYAEIPIKMSVSGTYYSLAKFFDSISKLPRIVNVKDLKLVKKKKKAANIDLDASFTTVTFRILPQKPLKSKKGGKGKKGRKKGGKK